MSQFEQSEHQWPATHRIEQSVGSVNENEHELNHLRLSKLLFPCQIWFQFLSSARQTVVAVHERVNKRVDERHEAGVGDRMEFEAETAAQRHDSVMEQVQKCDLVVFLAQHEKDGVAKIEKFGDHKTKAKIHDQRFAVIVHVWLVLGAVPRVKAPVGDPKSNQCADTVHSDQNRIVMKH